MPSVLQGQEMRTHSAKLLSVVSWMKSRNPRLGWLLFKLVQRPTCLGTQNPISWPITPRRILNLLSAIIDTREGKCWEQLQGSEPRVGNSPPAFEREHDFVQRSPWDGWERKMKSLPERFPEEPWKQKVWPLQLLPCCYYLVPFISGEQLREAMT